MRMAGLKLWKRGIICLVVSGLTLAGGHAAQAQDKPEKPEVPAAKEAKPKDHLSEFIEDPFVTKFRRLFFSVFEGKTDGYEQGMKELEAMLAKDPKDARALVWHGNGLMIRAGMLRFAGKSDESKKLLVKSKEELDRAILLDPDNVSLLAMRAVTIYGMGTYFPEADMPEGGWQELIADLEKARKIIRPDRMVKLSVHARGEILTELATGYMHTKQDDRARALWNETLKAVPNSRYADKAQAALKTLDKKKSATSGKSATGNASS